MIEYEFISGNMQTFLRFNPVLSSRKRAAAVTLVYMPQCQKGNGMALA
jgi:hypothetical protein